MVECVHPSHGAPSVGFAFQVLDRGLSCSSLWHPGKSKVLWKDDHMMRYQHFATSQKHPKSIKSFVEGLALATNPGVAPTASKSQFCWRL